MAEILKIYCIYIYALNLLEEKSRLVTGRIQNQVDHSLVQEIGDQMWSLDQRSRRGQFCDTVLVNLYFINEYKLQKKKSKSFRHCIHMCVVIPH